MSWGCGVDQGMFMGGVYDRAWLGLGMGKVGVGEGFFFHSSCFVSFDERDPLLYKAGPRKTIQSF